MIISKEELQSINGGGYRWFISAVIAVGAFISGFVEGFTRTNSCSR